MSTAEEEVERGLEEMVEETAAATAEVMVGAMADASVMRPKRAPVRPIPPTPQSSSGRAYRRHSWLRSARIPRSA